MVEVDKKLKPPYYIIMLNFNNKIKNLIIDLFDYYNILKLSYKLTNKQGGALWEVVLHPEGIYE